ncbi:four helix bundle protein [Rhodohalobacter sp.]|uniref:four helix bundle protein n=1 Tax=Rhodohalobacter sp. TaxID=1974210 RepID=UPI002ACECB9F|nr:four helix bundle protein [Rhodohalobacter sp.]MDZ7754986.1 four helix bundle protein [Rhodohalobacter sp.]
MNPEQNPTFMLNLNHKNLKVWQQSIIAVKETYRLTTRFPDNEKFGLVSQMRRSAISIASNISEGAARKSKTERARFYEIARSSLVELDTQYEISLELGYLKSTDLLRIENSLNATFAMLSKMISSTY